MHLSLNLNDPNEGKRAIKELEKCESQFPFFTRGYLYHLASMIHLSESNWNRALFYQNRSSLALKGKPKINGWTNYFVKALCYFEMGQFGEAKRNLKFIDTSSLEPESYPMKIYDLLMDLIRLDRASDLIEERLNIAHNELGELLLDENEKFHSHYFNIIPWIKSKVEEVEIQEVLSSDQDLRWVFRQLAS